MKRLILGLVTAALVGGAGAAGAQPWDHDRYDHRYDRDYNRGYDHDDNWYSSHGYYRDHDRWVLRRLRHAFVAPYQRHQVCAWRYGREVCWWR